MASRFRPRRPLDLVGEDSVTKAARSSTGLTENGHDRPEPRHSHLRTPDGVLSSRGRPENGLRENGSDRSPHSSASMEKYQVLIRISCEAGSALLEQIQTFVSAYASGRFRPKIAERISVATCELLDNAVSYGSISGDVVYELAESSNHLEVRVSNDAVHARLAMLRERAAKLEKDAEAIYMGEMARSVQGGIPRAMLGLARVRHESGMELEVRGDGQRVTVIGRCSR
jgi:hypothetical protein